MPIPVRCPGCRGHLSAPDATAGRKGRCPKCRARVMIPAAAPPAPAPPRPAAPSAERPRRAVAAAVGLLMLGTVGVGAYYLITTDATGTAAPPEAGSPSPEVPVRAAIPPGWQEFAPEGGGFRAFLPGPPAEHGPGVYLAHGRDPDLTCMVAVQPLPADVPEDQRDAVADGLAAMTARPPNRELARRAANLAGRPATELVVELPGGLQAVVRAVRFGDRVFTLTITGAAGRPPPALSDGFFDNFRLRP